EGLRRRTWRRRSGARHLLPSLRVRGTPSMVPWTRTSASVSRVSSRSAVRIPVHVTARPRTPLVRLAVAVLAAGLLAAGCTGSPAPEETDGAPSASTPSDAGGASDGGGATAAAVPQEAWEVTPAPEGFTPPEPCTGEGA